MQLNLNPLMAAFQWYDPKLMIMSLGVMLRDGYIMLMKSLYYN